MTNTCTCKAEHWQPHADSCPLAKQNKRSGGTKEIVTTLAVNQCGVLLCDRPAMVCAEHFGSANLIIADLRIEITQLRGNLERIQQERLTWAMVCECACDACEKLSSVIRQAPRPLLGKPGPDDMGRNAPEPSTDPLKDPANAEVIAAMRASPRPADEPNQDDRQTPAPSGHVGLGTAGGASSLHQPRAIVNEQAEDEGLWFLTPTASEAYLQQALRRLHAAVESSNEAVACHPDPTGKTREPPHCPSCSCGIPPHTTEENFQHFLAYSNLKVDEHALRWAFYAGKGEPPPGKASAEPSEGAATCDWPRGQCCLLKTPAEQRSAEYDRALEAHAREMHPGVPITPASKSGMLPSGHHCLDCGADLSNHPTAASAHQCSPSRTGASHE